MKKIYFFLSVLLMSFTKLCTAQCPSGSQSISGDNLNIGAGNYCLTSGTYSGNISSISSNAVIYISSGANFKPQNINGGLSGTFYIYGESTMPNVSLKSGFKLTNYGKVNFSNGVTMDGSTVRITNSGELTFNNGLNFNGSDLKVENKTGGVLRVNSNLPIGNTSSLDNSGTVYIQGDLNLNFSSSAFYNRSGAVARVQTNFNPKGSVLNDGLMVVNGLTNVNSTTSVVNNCRFVSVLGLTNDATSTFTNNGLVWCPGGKIQNNSGASFELGTRSVMRGGDFGNDGKVTGAGKMHFTGSTTQQGNVFAGTSAASPITFYDASQTGTQMFDIQNKPFTNTIRVNFTPADTTTFDCSGLVLPVQLVGFDAQAVQNKSVLITWQSSTEINLKKFVVERSSTTSSNTWETVGSLNAAGNSATLRNYQITDSKPLSGTSYYRLRSADMDGKETVSAIRQVNIDGKAGSIQVYPTLVQKGSIVKVVTAEQVRYQLLDISGKVLKSGSFVSGANVLPLNINTGNYIIETVNGNNVRQYSKIIVQ